MTEKQKLCNGSELFYLVLTNLIKDGNKIFKTVFTMIFSSLIQKCCKQKLHLVHFAKYVEKVP